MKSRQCRAILTPISRALPTSRFVSLAAFVPGHPRWSLVIEPIDDTNAVVEFLVTQGPPDYYLTPGIVFYLHEGHTVVAEGIITEGP